MYISKHKLLLDAQIYFTHRTKTSVLTHNSDMRLLSKSLITWIISALIISFGITACTVPPPESLPNEVSWADSVHAQMTLEEKVAQMMMVDVPPLGDITSPSDRNRLNRHILNGKAGGVLLFAGHPLHYAPWIEWVQHQGSVP